MRLDSEGDGPIVVAIGGNSLLKAGQVGNIDEQRENAEATCEVLADIMLKGPRLIITHGNGPQVGNVLLRVEVAAEVIYRLPLDVCDSDTQGGIGYMLQQILGDKLVQRGRPRNVATIVTQVVVNENDPAFQNPTKPIGSFMAREEAEERRVRDSWAIRKIDSRGYRRVVPSPIPLRIVELPAIRAVVDAGITCVCVGGGGIPVTETEDGRLLGCEAVIDKDRATSLLARELGVRTFIITTSVPHVLLDYEKPTERPVHHLTVKEARRYHEEGHFPPGSMGPKIESAIDFLEAGGQRALITDPDSLRDAINGQGGTWIVP
jgi:carbamate kinase